nr:rep protein [Cressdnaviricota sp.]UOF79165.1 rep protein [Cressdnaviricota sp.]UOF81669.1 rep protein [Cressdnaviricota sp.]UOF82586.1 rep protein [Cressdnaviricota sp.]UOF82848.1 rep protein [Cressdnaviricota sp.]
MSSSKEKKKLRFRLQATKLFLTFPQCTTTKESALERILGYAEWKVDYAIVASEKHKDGSPHLHCVVALKERFKTLNASFADFVGGTHGNYQSVRSVKSVLAYVTKENNFVAHGVDVKELQRGLVGKLDSIALMVRDGLPVQEIAQQHPGSTMINFKKIQDWRTIQEMWKIKSTKIPWTGFHVMEKYSYPVRQIVKWMNENICCQRKFKQTQLMIVGPKNTGKTSLIEALNKWLRIYYIPFEDFYDFYYDDQYDIVVFDEFKAQKTIQWLNLFLQGAPMNIRKKGSQYMKMKNLPVIILSNYLLEDAYKNSDEEKLETLRSRLEIVEVQEFIDIDWEEFNTPRVEEESQVMEIIED